MAGQMIEMDAHGERVPGYLAMPGPADAPGVVVLHAWWGLTEPFRQACDRLAEAGFVALAPDLYRGRSTAQIEEADALGSALDQRVEQWRGDVRGAVEFLRRNGQVAVPTPAGGQGRFALVGFSLGGAYALDLSVTLPEQIAAVVTFYAAWPEPDFRRARAAYLCHFAEHDPFESPGASAEMEQALQAAGRPVTGYTYP